MIDRAGVKLGARNELREYLKILLHKVCQTKFKPRIFFDGSKKFDNTNM